MHYKNIKTIIRKQLKTNYRGWKRLKRREKKEIAKKVFDEVVTDYDFSKEIETDKLDLLGIEQQELTSGHWFSLIGKKTIEITAQYSSVQNRHENIN